MKQEKVEICQSCGMPINKDPEGGGTNLNSSKSHKYCSYCYQKGKFLDEGITLQDKINKNIDIAMTRFGMSEQKAREMAEMILEPLERWKK